MVRRSLAVSAAVTSVLVISPGPPMPLRAERPDAVAQPVAAVMAPLGPDARARLAENLGQIPLHFTRNDGNVGGEAEFFARGCGYSVGLSRTTAVIRLTSGSSTAADRAEIGVSLVGASSSAGVGEERLAGVQNVYRGNAPSEWRTGLPTFAKVRYRDVYHGIDLVYYGNQRRLQYDFVIAPGGNPDLITWRLEGADALQIDAAGSLRISVGGRIVEQEKPFTYQLIDGERREVPSGFALGPEGTVRFEVGAYDASLPLVIDPVLTYSSWFGGSSQESISDIAVDSNGNILVTGDSEDRDGFPTTPGALRTSRGADLAPADAFVAKFSPSGATLLFSTLLGGSEDDNLVASGAVGGVAALPNGNVVVVGATKSADFPVLAADDPSFNETAAIIDPDAFMTILSPTGALVSSTFLGGADVDFATNVDVDAAGKIYVVGITRSDSVTEGFPITASTYDGTFGGTSDAFLVRYSGAGAREYATYIGGSGTEYANPNADVVVDTNGVVFVGGETSSTDFPTKNGFQSTQGGGSGAGDGFVIKLDTSVAGSAGLLWGSLFGGNNDETFAGIARDATGKVYAGGYIRSTNIPTTVIPGGSAPVAANFDGLVVKFDPAQSGAASLAYAFRISGTGLDTVEGVAVDSGGRAWVVGNSSSPGLPLKNAFDSSTTVTGRPFVAQINPAGTDTLLLSYAGGRNTNSTRLTSVAMAPFDQVLMAGHASEPASNSHSLQLVNPYQSVYGGGAATGGDLDGVIQKLGPSADLSISKTSAPASPSTVLPGQQLTYTLSVSNGGPDAATGITVTDTLPTTVIVTGCSATGGGVCAGSGNARSVTFASLASGASATVTFTTTVSGAALPGTAITNTATVAADTFDPNSANNSSTTSISVPTLNDPTGDADNDGLPNGWEQDYGLNPLSNVGENGAAGDPDGDGKTNAEELAEGTHPRGFVITYLAEGATGSFFRTRILIANPTSTQALVLTRFQKSNGTTIRRYQVVPPMSRATIDVGTLAGLEAAEFSTLIEADVQVVADRTMTWPATGASQGYGAHSERGILTRTATTWYLAEGATLGEFDLFYLIQNPNAQTASVEVRYLLPTGPPIVKTYTVPGQSRFNIWVDQEGPALANAEVSAVVQSTNGVPIIVERAMYLSAPGRPFAAGHESAGVTAPATNWFLAEGATGDFFDLFILVANPNPQAAALEARYLLTTGQVITKTYTSPPNSRFNIWVDLEDPILADAAVSTTITSTNGVPIIVERAMWWPGPTSATWYEAHNSPGSTETGVKWAMAEGEVGGSASVETYILIANTSGFAGTGRVTLVFEDGTTPVSKDFALPPNSRTNVAVAAEFGAAAGKVFGAIVESVGGSPARIVVERAVYYNAGGLFWSAGTNALATKIE